MERLTMIDGIGNDELVRCMGCGLEKAGENLENCGFCEEGWQKALKKLAAYEDTGLDPEDFKKAFNEESFLTMTAQMMGITPERLRDLAKADREGRCVVLTDRGCTDKDGENALKSAMNTVFYHNNPVTRYIADAVVEKLTREAAEAALKGGNHETDSV